jgi:hypothetical protein
VVCSLCAERIKSGQQAPPALSLARAVLFGIGAALAGSILYALVSIITGFQFALMAIVVGIMVGKIIRYSSGGLGGRPQQVLAVVLTYFSITTSYIPVAIHYRMTHARPAAQAQTSQARSETQSASQEPLRPATPRMSFGRAIVFLLLLAAAAPFLSLGSMSGLISLFIIFIGLRQAWRLTGRSEILIMGPYEATP